jgi:hypothetical protein
MTPGDPARAVGRTRGGRIARTEGATCLDGADSGATVDARKTSIIRLCAVTSIRVALALPTEPRTAFTARGAYVARGATASGLGQAGALFAGSRATLFVPLARVPVTDTFVGAKAIDTRKGTTIEGALTRVTSRLTTRRADLTRTLETEPAAALPIETALVSVWQAGRRRASEPLFEQIPEHEGRRFAPCSDRQRKEHSDRGDEEGT